MNYIDVALIVIIVVIGFRGFATGFIAEVCSLIGILLGVYLGSIFAIPVGDWLKKIYDFGSPTIHLAIGFLIILLVCWTFFSLLSAVLSKRALLGGFSFIDKGLGFVFASIKIFFIFSFIAYAISHINFIKENFDKTAREKSQMYVNMIKVADKIIKFPVVNQTIENIQQTTNLSSQTLENGMQQVKDNTKQVADSIQDSLKDK